MVGKGILIFVIRADVCNKQVEAWLSPVSVYNNIYIIYNVAISTYLSVCSAVHTYENPDLRDYKR